MSKQVTVKMISSPDMQRLVINDNVKAEQEIIPYDVLFTLIGEETKETCNVEFHYEWTADLATYDQGSSEIFKLDPKDALRISIGDIDDDFADHPEADPNYWEEKINEGK